MTNWLLFNGRSTRDFNIWISGEGTYNAPGRRVSNYSIPGRSGDLIIDEGAYENIEITYPAYIAFDFQEHIAAWRAYALAQKGYGRLEDTYHQDEYRKALYSSAIEVETFGVGNTEGAFNITFNTKPQRYLKSGDLPVEYTSKGKIFNRTEFQAKPLIRCYGSGTFSIGHEVIRIATSHPYIDIDCDMMDAYYDTVNCNDEITLSSGEFPVLDPGSNGIDPGDLNKLILYPRWWTL